MTLAFAGNRAHARVARADTPVGDAATAADTEAARLLPAWRAAEYLAARALLRRLLAEVAGPAAAVLPIAADEAGRPHLPDRPDLTISLSHEGDWVAAAVGLGVDVGVDVQPPQPASEGLRRRCCTPRARRALAELPAADRDREFAWIWTVQEACVKADGTGVAGLPWTVPVEVGQRAGVWGDYRWRRLPDSIGVPASFAYRGSPDPEEVATWSSPA
ncbi:4'-phosphopantetheinyl transferase superfamily protein [Solihabitans fulvus]|uniref:4'-phosphopantetheinyl transferase superfamily protein n=1 Tax=Solihabitans fulvus TaxID=1892852 RepID=A0A5B2WUC2_9PSEU|nr:4'-phosphopantetheinyl transferase superfamily protein [Solihabitans fulvus]KAA2255361.1 4'-phosphopantetheinyl transferase superfamily protein [Solihabitans fulvus]